MGRGSNAGGEDKSDGAMEKLKGRLKEAAGVVSGDENLKAEGRSDQRRGAVKEKKGKLKELLE